MYARLREHLQPRLMPVVATTATTERAAGWEVEATAATAAKATAPADTAAARAAEAATAMALHDCHWGPLRCHLCSDHLARLVLKATCAYARHAICDRINREQNCSFSCAKQDPSRHARDRHHMGTVAHGRWAS